MNFAGMKKKNPNLIKNRAAEMETEKLIWLSCICPSNKNPKMELHHSSQKGF